MKKTFFACSVLIIAAFKAAAAVPPAAGDPYGSFAFLIGHCWQGTFAGASSKTDTHCFSRVYGGKFVRDEHVVHPGDGTPDQFGESIYLWDSAAGQLQYVYIESGGGILRGTVASEDGALIFPAAAYIENGRSMNLRARWQPAGDDAYDVTTEFELQGRWVTGFALHMQRVRS